MSLDRYLEKLASQGAADSRGFFTLDQAEAIRKLREYQVAEPSEFVLSLVASAVASQAEWVKAESVRGGFRLEHNGATIPHGYLVTLFSSLLEGRNDREFAAVRELAFALNALTALRPSRIRVTCSSAEELVLVELTPEKLQVIQADPFETYGNKKSTIVQAQALKGNLSTMVKRRLGQAPERDILERRCWFSPIPIFWGDERIQPKNLLPPAQCTMKVGAPPRIEELDWPTAWMSLDGACDAYVGISPGVSLLIVVAHGISFRVPDSELPENMSAIVYGDQFRKDLSQAGFVKDKVFEAAGQALRACCHDFLAAISENPSGFTHQLLREVVRSLKSEANLARQKWEPENAERLSASASRLSLYLK